MNPHGQFQASFERIAYGIDLTHCGVVVPWGIIYYGIIAWPVAC